MSIIRPFRAFRPPPELAPSIAALPYDLYNSSQARRIVNAEPMSFLNIYRSETLRDEGNDIYYPKFYEKARHTLSLGSANV